MTARPITAEREKLECVAKFLCCPGGCEAEARSRRGALVNFNCRSDLKLETAKTCARLLASERGMREALEAIDALEVMEINPSNYDHELVCELSSNASQAACIAREALAALTSKGEGEI